MSEAKRQVGIKTRSVKRLAADVKSYLLEKSTHQTRLDTLSAASSTEAHELKRAREFVEEAEATIQDVRQRLQEAYHVLENFIEELEQQGDAEVLADQCFVDARKMLEDVAPLVTVAADEHKERGFKISVFGGSALTEDDDFWRSSEELGEKLGRAGYHVLTGGYNGTSEAVSFGASRVPQTKIEGVTCPAAFPTRLASQYLNVETKTASLCERAGALVQHADAFVVLPGNLGTLTKFILTWNLSSLELMQSKPHLTLLVWRQPWEQVIQDLAKSLNLSRQFIEGITYVDSVDQIMEELEKMKQHKKHSKLFAHGASTSSSSSAATPGN